jgi:small conductance mechanosensitive channel
MDRNLWNEMKIKALNLILEIGPLLLYSLLTLVLGIFAIKLIMRILKKTLVKSKVELSLKTFIESLSIFVLYGILFFAIGSIIGITSTSFLAVFGAVGIAIGLALQGSLSNFAGGLLILIFKPFKVGDLIFVNNIEGFVIKIDILYTRVKTFDGRMITMPNGNVSNSDVDNRTMEEYRRIDLKLKFSFDSDLEQLRTIIIRALKKHPQLAPNHEVDVWLDEIGEYELKVVARCWVDSMDYWPLFWEQLEAVKNELDNEGIKIPLPSRTVYQGSDKKIVD